jgi:hypothetical protein
MVTKDVKIAKLKEEASGQKEELKRQETSIADLVNKIEE